MKKYVRSLFCKTGLLLFALLSSLLAFAQTTTVRGTIKDPNGLPLQGASVTVEGTKKGVIDDVDYPLAF